MKLIFMEHPSDKTSSSDKTAIMQLSIQAHNRVLLVCLLPCF